MKEKEEKRRGGQPRHLEHWVSVVPSRRCFSLALNFSASKLQKKPGQTPIWLPGGAGRRGLGMGGGYSVRPHLFSTPLILLLPAAPHTKPQSLIPKVGRRGGQLYSAAPFRASYVCPSAGSGQQGWLSSPSALVWKLAKVSTWEIPVAFV